MTRRAQSRESLETDSLQPRAYMSPQEHAERLAYDVDTVLQLQLHAWSDEAWEPVAEALAEYGWAVMKGWLFNRAIFREVAKAGAPVEECPHEWLDEDTVGGLASETVAKALHEFKRVLQQGRWDATRGASLATYFIGQCKFQFPNIYRKWLTAEKEYRRNSTPWDPAVHDRPWSDPAAQPSRGEEILTRMSPKAARVFQLKVDGYTYQEIAEMVPEMKNAKAVENLVNRERARWMRDRAS